MVTDAYRRDTHLSGLATDFKDLDDYMGGLQKSDLVIVAGRPGMGKTSLATNIAFNIAHAFQGDTKADRSVDVLTGGRVAFFSLEMSAEQLGTRIISEQTAIPSTDLRRGKINDADYDKI